MTWRGLATILTLVGGSAALWWAIWSIAQWWRSHP